MEQSAGTHFPQGGHWSEDAQSYYWCHWNIDGFAEPQYNWASPELYSSIESILEHWNGSGIMEALKMQNPDILDKALTVCNAARSRDVVCWSYLSWGDEWIPKYRLMEIAVLIATGHMTDVIPSYLNNFQEYHWNMLKRLLKVTAFDAMSPISPRTRIMPRGSDSCYVLLCESEDKPVLCVLNLSEKAQNIGIDLSVKLHSQHHLWRDEISGNDVAEKEHYLRFSVPAYGFAFSIPLV